jgi:phosphoserine phosphatase
MYTPRMFKAVVFDIDGTLTRDISWVKLTTEIGGSLEFNDEVIKKWETDELTESEAREKLIENWSKAGKATKKEFVSILQNISLREDAKEVVDYLKNKGYVVIMITGSFDLYAQIVGEKLDVKEWFANTVLMWDEDGSLLDVQTCKDSEAQNRKVDFFKAFCDKNNLKINECVAVGDSSNDIALFKLTGKGIAVRTEFESPKLEEVAWKKVNQLIEIKSIL